ncbi:anillin-like [Tribolium madens]|uniref:anillin-like n=1 Tax=Tribolium madens TaxID=41895 RepID=UPI001CF756A7|nr:anillin-like [Tribolium madens]
MKTVYNSTFNENLTSAPTEMENLWQGSSLSSIEEIFDPVKIKNVVDSLVMSRFSGQIIKSRSRRSRFTSSSSEDVLSSSENHNNVFHCVSNGRSDVSINTCNLSDLISNPYPYTSFHNGNIYISDSCFEMESSEASEELNDYDSIHSKIDLLNTKIFVLSQNKEQILKAIYYDDFYNKAKFSKVRLEAEKLLLINDLTSDLLTQDAKFLFEEKYNEQCSGSIKISNCNIWCDNQDFDQFFICVVIYGTKILASELTQTKSNGIIHFKKEFLVKGLRPDFIIDIKIYSASKKAIRKSKKSFICNYAPRPEENIIMRKSLFTLRGETQISIEDLSKSNFMEVQMNSGRFTSHIFSYVNLNLSLSGFLNVSQSQQYALWNREWCCLEGRYLQYFDYPPDETYECKPLEVIDLATCIEFKRLSREECPRKQTLLLKTYFGKTVLLSCDSRTELECWENCIKQILSAIEIWEH